MNSYLQSTACKGRKPKQLPLFHHQSRSTLLAKMLQERNVVRFLVAPKSFGKTALALEYAESIFSLEHVFWVDAKHPCFLRDLDKGIIGSGLLAQSTQASLVVFDDLPYLNSDRCEGLSKTFDALLARGWEVVATTVPTCDVFDSCQVDKVRFDARALLLDDEEVNASCGVCDAKVLAHHLLIERIPGIYWGGSDRDRRFLSGIAQEDLPAEMLLPLFVMMVLKRGTFEDIAALTRCWRNDVVAALAADHPYLGIDLRGETFDAASFAMDDIAATLGTRLEKMALASRCDSADVFVAQLAHLLLKSQAGEGSRACALMSLCGAPQRMQWLAIHQEALLRDGILVFSQRLFESIPPSCGEKDASLLVLSGWRLLLLGNRTVAIEQACRVVFDCDADRTDRMLAGLLAARYGDEEVSARSQEVLAALALLDTRDRVDMCRRLSVEASKLLCVKAPPNEVRIRFLEFLNAVFLCLRFDAEQGLTLVCEQVERGKVSKAPEYFDLGAIVMIMSLERIQLMREQGQMTKASMQLSHRLAAGVRSFVSDAARLGVMSVCVGRLVEKMEGCGLLTPETRQVLPDQFFVHVQDWNTVLLAQQNEYAKSQQSVSPSIAADTYTKTLQSLHACDVSEKSIAIPRLYIRLFGGLEIQLGSQQVDPRLFRRQKVQTLCAILVLNRGKEISRAALCESLWPESLPEKARNNLYSTWSMLRRALTSDSGSCPYLVRLQRSCKIDASLVTSDVFELGKLCDQLLFSSPDVEVFSPIYTQIVGLYTGDLLPGESENSIILRHRNELRTRLVDALVAAANALYRARELPAALQFARAALRYDETREDVYKILIQVQIAAGQRSSAMQTYFRCRNYLTTELGIDPSAQMVALYNQMITEDIPVVQQLTLPLS
ncbi:MAG: bacterial transcriptional activator domain-containing protein [Raoultibacter sp.]